MNEIRTIFGQALGRPYASLGALFQRSVQRTPQAEALRYEDRTLSYEELAGAVGRCIAALQEQGLRRGDIVGINIPRSDRYVVLTLAIMFGGFVYVPMAHELPDERLRRMAEIARPRLVVSDEAGWLPDSVRSVSAEQLLSAEGTGTAPELWPELRRDELCYIIFTSGTTGEPKGVQIPHGAFVNRLLWAGEYYGLSGADVIMSKTALTFDPSIQELVLPFIAGCRLFVAHPRLLVLPNYLIDCIIKYRISMLIVVPSLLRQILQAEHFVRCTSLRHVVCCGEPWSADLITLFHQALPSGDIYNGYGPTETTIGTLVYRPPRGYQDSFIPIGRPIKGVHVAIVDEACNNVAPGEVGELIIGGICVGAGYIGSEELNRLKFANLMVEDVGPTRFYLSGDLARQAPSGEIIFMGRKDNQVKINGVRVELEEVEHVLKQHEAVVNAVVVKSRDRFSDTLHAFVTTRHAGVDKRTLQLHCESRLNSQVIPSFFHLVEDFPLTQNGKVDRHALLERHRAGELAGGERAHSADGSAGQCQSQH